MYCKSNERRLKKRFYISRLQNKKCIYCGQEMWVDRIDPPGEPQREATLEHIIPQKHGGTDKYENIVCSCKECNNKRGHIPHEEFMKIRKQEDWTEILKQKREQRGIEHKLNNALDKN